MPSTYTEQLKLENPAPTDRNWQVGWYRNSDIMELMLWQISKGNYVEKGGNLSGFSGLTFTMDETSVNVGGVSYTVFEPPAPAFSLFPGTATVNKINYLYVDSSGVLQLLDTLPTSEEYCMIAMIDASDTSMVIYNDMRVDPPRTGIAVPPSGVDLVGDISGLLLGSHILDPDNDVTLSPGACYDSTGNSSFTLGSELFKRLDAPWTVGSSNGGMLIGSKAANTSYNVYLFQNDSDKSLDMGFIPLGTSLSGNLPAGYTKYRWVGFIRTNSSSVVNRFVMTPNSISLSSSIPSVTASSTSWQGKSIAGDVPAGKTCFIIFGGGGAVSSAKLYLSSTDPASGGNTYGEAFVDAGSDLEIISGDGYINRVSVPTLGYLWIKGTTLTSTLLIKTVEFLR